MEDVNSVPKVGLIGENMENKMYDISILQNTEIQNLPCQTHNLEGKIVLNFVCLCHYCEMRAILYHSIKTLKRFPISNFDDLLTPSNT